MVEIRTFALFPRWSVAVVLPNPNTMLSTVLAVMCWLDTKGVDSQEMVARFSMGEAKADKANVRSREREVKDCMLLELLRGP